MMQFEDWLSTIVPVSPDFDLPWEGGRATTSSACLVEVFGGNPILGTASLTDKGVVLVVIAEDGVTSASAPWPLADMLGDSGVDGSDDGWTGSFVEFATAISKSRSGLAPADDDGDLNGIAAAVAMSPMIVLVDDPLRSTMKVQIHCSRPPYVCLFDPDGELDVTVVPLTESVLEGVVHPLLLPWTPQDPTEGPADDSDDSDTVIQELLGQWVTAAFVQPRFVARPVAVEPRHDRTAPLARVVLRLGRDTATRSYVLMGSTVLRLSDDTDAVDAFQLGDLITVLRSDIAIDELAAGTPLDAIFRGDDPEDLFDAAPHQTQRWQHRVLELWTSGDGSAGDGSAISRSLAWSQTGSELWGWGILEDGLGAVPAQPNDVLASILELIADGLFGP